MPQTLHELYSLDFDEIPGLVPGLGDDLDNAETTLEIIASVMKPTQSVKVAAPKGPVPDLGPSTRLSDLSLEDLDAQYQATREARKHVSRHLQDKLKQRSVERATSSRCSTRATSRSSYLSSKLCSELSTWGSPDLSCHLTSSLGPSPVPSYSPQTSAALAASASSVQSTSHAHWTSQTHSVDFVPAVWPFPEPIPHKVPSRIVKKVKPSLQPAFDQDGIEFVPAVWPFPEPIPYGVPSRTPRPRSMSPREVCPSPLPAGLPEGVELTAGQAARSRKAEFESGDFIKANQQLGNSWMSLERRTDYEQAWMLEHEKEIWVQSKNEKKKSRIERQWLLRKMRPKPFENWYQETTKAAEILKKTVRNLWNGDEPNEDHATGGSSPKGKEDPRRILRKLTVMANRGFIERSDREAAQQLAIQRLKHQWLKGSGPSPGDQIKDFELLTEDIRKGGCVLTEKADGSIQRVVALLTFRLERAGNMLAEVGEADGRHIKPLCRLPGAKQMDFESAETTLMRELNTTYAPFKDQIHLTDLKVEEVSGRSTTFGLASLYQKSVQHCSMRDQLPLPALPLATPKGIVPPSFRKHIVFALMHAGKIRLFSWLTPEMFKHLSGTQGKDELMMWMDALEIDELDAFNELAWTRDYEAKAKISSDNKQTMKQMDPSVLHELKMTFNNSSQRVMEVGTTTFTSPRPKPQKQATVTFGS